MACISLVCSLWDPHGDTQHRVARRWSRILLAISGVPCRTFGLEKLDPAESYVLVSNHASYMDTPAIVGCIPLQFRFLAKDTLFSLPFLGWHLGRAGHVPVVRGDARASLKSLSTGARLLRERHLSLWVFPEGGRTPDRMRRFEEGAAYLAIKAGVPIVPIGLVGTRRALPMHSWKVRAGTIEVHVGDPIPTAGMSPHDRGRLNAMLIERVAELAQEPLPVAATA